MWINVIEDGMLTYDHVSTQGTLSRVHVSTYNTLACEHVSTQGTLARKAREHVFSTLDTQFSRLEIATFVHR